ncbi:T9SS type A sorting domain-containing protein [Soonwooa purpurea]
MKTKLLSFKLLLLVALSFLSSNAFGQTKTITINTTSIGGTAVLGTGAYADGAERAWSQDDVSFGGKAITANQNNTPSGNSAGTLIQVAATDDVFYNTTALPGKLVSVTLNSTGTARTYSLQGGNDSRLVNNVAKDYTVTGGTAVGSASSTGWTSTVLSGTDYKYFAIKRASSSASYITSIVIEYEDVAPTTPTLSVSTDEINDLGYILGASTSISKLVSITGMNLDGSKDVLIGMEQGSLSNFEISLAEDGTYGPDLFVENYDGSALNVYVRLKTGMPIANNYEDILDITTDYTGIDDLGVLVYGAVTTPIIITDPQELTPFSTNVGATDSKDIAISGSLSTDVATEITGADAVYFSVSPNSVTAAGGTITISYHPTQPGNHTAILKLSTNGGVTKELTLTGNAVVAAPVAIDATNITGTSFVANWNAVPNATSYKVNVYKETGGINPNVNVVSWNFENEKITATGGIIANSDKVVSTNATLNIPPIIKISNPASDGFVLHANGGWGSGSESKYWKISFTTLNMTNLKMSSVQRSSNTGPRDFKVQYSLDELNWTDLSEGNVTVLNDWASGHINKISLPIACDNKPLVYLRWIMNSNIAVNGGSVQSGGTSTIDNILVDGDESSVVKTPIVGSPFTVAAPATFANITGLEADTDYFYTVEALMDTYSSTASNEIAVSTADRVIWDGTAWNNVVGPNAQVNAEIAGVYDVTTDFVAKDLSVTTGSLAIQPGHSVTVHGALSQSADDLITVESDASLLQVEGSTHDGKTITVKRHAHVPANQYNLWSSPVVAQDLYALYGAAGPVPADKVMEYITKTDTFKPMATGSKSESAKGYSALGLASNDVTAIFNGVPHNGPVSYDAGANTGQGDGYNLIGNPYPSNFDLDKFYSLNKNALDGETVAEPGVNVGDNTAYFWDNTDNVSYGQYGSNYNGDNYAVYNFSSKTGIGAPAFNETGGGKVPTAIIKPGQGFIVKLKNTTSSLNFDNTMRTSDTSPVYFKTEAPKRYWLELTTPKQLIISTAVVYNEAAVNTYDKYDTAANTFASDGFYTMTSNAKAVSIQGRQDVNIKDDVVPVGIKAYEAGDYSIRFAKGDNIFADGQDVYLKDNSLNKIVKLSDAGYHFALDKGVNTTRFEIVYQSKTLAVDAVNSQKEIVVYKDADSFVVKARSNAITKVEVYDMLGRLVLVSDKASKEVRIANASLVEGTYVLKISQNNNIVTQKVIK